MRMIRAVVAVAGAWFLSVSPAAAGVYSNDPLDQIPGQLTFPQFRQFRDRYFAAAAKGTGPYTYYSRLADRLEKQEQDPLGLSTDERVTLSACYLRLQQPGMAEKAIRVLSPVAGERNFMVHANLATAYQQSGQLERAVDYQEMALKEWPTSWPGMTQTQLSWFYRVEKYDLTLLRSRLREQRVTPGKEPETLDELFPGVRFVGASGRYEAGSIDPLQYARLPADHLSAVAQLVLWMPTDARLSWLLAELLNANGNIADAFAWMHDLSYNRGYHPNDLKEHRLLLKEPAEAVAVWNLRGPSSDDVARMMWAITPRGSGAPGAPAIANLEAAYSFAHIQQPAPRPESKDNETSRPAESSSATPPALPSTQHVIVSFLAGVVLTLLAGMQIREMRRRREGVAADKT